jgi:hypothetical protein
MNKFILSLFLITPVFANTIDDADHIDLNVGSRNLKVSVGQIFEISATKPFRNCWDTNYRELNTNPWQLGSYSPFQLLFEGWNDIMAANTQIWRFKATQVGTYKIEFLRECPPICPAIQHQTIFIEVQ